MNRFRVAILVFLVLALGLLFYVACFVLPARQEQHAVYLSEQQEKNLIRRSESYRNLTMEQQQQQEESNTVADARAKADAEEAKRAKALADAEESAVIASARRKEEAAAAQNPDKQLSNQAPIGLVTAYSSDWNSLMFKPVSDTPMNNGLVVAVRHEGRIICEAVVDGLDEPSGQISALVKNSDIGNDGKEKQKIQPVLGDEVIVSPFPSSEDLRKPQQDLGGLLMDATVPLAPAQDSNNSNNAAPSAPEPQPATDSLPEIEATLVPVP